MSSRIGLAGSAAWTRYDTSADVANGVGSGAFDLDDLTIPDLLPAGRCESEAATYQSIEAVIARDDETTPFVRSPSRERVTVRFRKSPRLPRVDPSS